MRALWFIFLSGVALGELPRLTIEHGENRQNLRLTDVDVVVRVEGDFVDTRMSLNFFNETDRNQEGEFRLPLPEGASVNHYALEVNGAMREASVVEREQARKAYESIKARNIDPGLVEKMEGNIYRTRIFPVLPKQSKRVSIGYVQPLEKAGDELVYRLPFGVVENIWKFNLRIEGDLTGITPEMSKGEKLLKDEKGFSYSSKDLPVEGDLLLKRKVKDDEFAGEIAEVDGEFFAYITGSVGRGDQDKKARNPKIITVVWDASARGYHRDLKTEIDFLEEMAKQLGDAVVQLVVVRDKAEELGQFHVKNGDWTRMREFIRGIFYDGAADWRTLDFKKLTGERIVLFTSGESSFPVTKFNVDRNFYVAQSLHVNAESVFGQMASDSGGAIIDLTLLGPDQASRLVMNPKPNVLELKGSVESSYSRNSEGHVRIFAKMNSLEENQVDLTFKHGSEIHKPVTVKLRETKSGGTFRYLWAQQKLMEMSRKSSFLTLEEKTAIIAHCQKYGLVSDFTSLIVLESMDDHVRYRIPPPEPELLADYESGLERLAKHAETPVARSELKYSWDDRSGWYYTKFPWAEVALLPRYLRVKQWTQAQTSVFEKEQLEQTNIAEFLNWKKEAERVMGESAKVASKEKFRVWSLQIEKLLDAGNQLGSTDAKLPEKGEFGVSVRGLVQNPQTMSLKNGTTLRQAIQKAGGLHRQGTESRISIYRSGKRTVYNLLSEEYQDVRLLPGDMIVAMPEDYSRMDMDPFAAAAGAGQGDGHKQEPAIVHEDIPLEMPTVRESIGAYRQLGGYAAAGRDVNIRPLLEGVLQQAGIEGAAEDMVKEMSKAQDFWSEYKKRRSAMGDETDRFTAIAEELYKRKEIKKARQVLSNLYGEVGFHVPSLRAAAYWMIQLNDHEGALEIFGLIGQIHPDDPQLVLDVMRLYRMAGGTMPAEMIQQVLPKMAEMKFLESNRTVVAEMVMMERNRFKVKGFEALNPNLLTSREVFASDIRIVVYTTDTERLSYLNIQDPTGVTITNNLISTTGGRLVNGEGVGEFMVRRALPGEYRLEVANVYRGVSQVEVFLNWGRPNETRRMFTISGQNDDREFLEAGVVKFDFSEPN